MGMPAEPLVTTIDDLLALPDDGLRHELLDGEHVVTPAPSYRHQDVLGELWDALRAATRDRDDLNILSSPADIRLNPRTLVQPDLFVVRIDPDHPPEDWADLATPILAVEILSPSTAARDRGKKRRLYMESGVEEYWIVDTDARVIERWRAGDERPEIVDGTLEWTAGSRRLASIDLPAVLGGPPSRRPDRS